MQLFLIDIMMQYNKDLKNSISISAFRNTEEALRRSEEEFRLLFENAKDAIFWADTSTGLIIKCNYAAEELLEKDKLEIIGCSQSELHPPDRRAYYSNMFKHHVNNGKVVDVEAEIITKNKKIRQVHITANVTVVRGKEIIQGIFRDITKRKIEEKELYDLNQKLKGQTRKLKRLSLKDPHTGVYNHGYCEEIIEVEIEKAKEFSSPLSIIMVDIDYFKSINDVYGHKFGDLVLQQFVKKIRKMIRLHDYVVRFGGEEFILVLPGSDRFNSFRIADKLVRSIKMYSFGDSEKSATLRLSAAVVSFFEDGVNDYKGLITVSERVLAKAKGYGGDRVALITDLNSSSKDKYSKVSTDINYLKEQLDRITKKSNQSLTESVFALVKTIDLKDHYTGNHVEKTVFYATELARLLGLSYTDIILIEQASMLHDLGKIGISEKILLKPGKLTKVEFNEIKRHPELGVDIIRPIRFFHDLIPLILHHHERWDGLGYPIGLKGEDIPFGARIISIADVYHALTSDRPYRKSLSEEEAKDIIRKGSGSQFDPDITKVFLSLLP
ncbi:MAG: diguanylate cyclase [Candidatus Omnitrophota bacterium]